MRMLKQVLNVEDGEWKQSTGSFFYFFFLMSSYFILRPVRDEMGIQAGIENMHWLFTGTFLVMVVLVPVFGLLLKKIARINLVPGIFLFFTLNIIVFYFTFQWLDAQLVATVFFIWLSVFNLFVISVFWSFSSDLFSVEQAKRLYGPIAAGGSLGAIVGPSLTSFLAEKIGILNLILVSALLLFVATFLVHLTLRLNPKDKMNQFSMPMNGSVWAGLMLLRKSPPLQLISVFIVLFTSISTFLYFQQGHIITDSNLTSIARTRYFGLRDLMVNSLTLILQFFLTTRIIRKWGLTLTLSIVPLASCAGFFFLGLHPSLYVLLAFQVIYRALNFALQRPSREILFASLTSEERYKSKNFIDTAIYRGGDALSGWVFAGLAVIVSSMPIISFIAIPIAMIWTFTGFRLGRVFYTI